MVISPLVQLLIVAALAYGAGLLLGLAFYRGEIGPSRPVVVGESGHGYRGGRSTSGHRGGGRRRNRQFSQFMDDLGERLRQVIGLVVVLSVITILGLGVYAMMKVSAQVLTGS
jgi:hypothetical protein